MKFQKYIKRLPALSFLIMLFCAGIFLSSCEDDEVISEDVVLESFGPSGVRHGETIKFIGRNLDKVTAIELPSATVEKGQFTTQTSELIELVVPREAQAGKVVLKTSKGDVTSRAMLSFEVPVVIESITAEARPGSDITIRGEMVNWIEEVVFSDGVSVTEFVSSSTEELVVTVPMEAQTGYLIFRSGGTDPLSFASEEELIVTVPTVTGLNPAAIKHTDNLTITGTDLDLVTSVIFPGDTVREFVSQSASEIVVTVPAKAEKGQLTLEQASPVDVVTTEELTIILPAATDISPKPAVPGVDDITITGENLDLVASLTLPGIVEPVAAADFKSHTAEEIVLALPDGADKGGIKYTTIHGYSGNLGVNVILPGAGPLPLAISLYDETIEQGGGNWSWNDVVNDPASTEQAYSGDVSWKFETDNEGGLSVGGMTAIDASEMGVFAFSLFGGPGTEGAEVAVVLNDDWNNTVLVTLAEGKWTQYQVPLSEFGSVDMSAIVRFAFKVETMTASTIYADRVGFDAGGPEPLDYYIYDDGLQNGWSQWDGWGHEALDFASTEEVFHGGNAIKVSYNDPYGAIQLGSPSEDVFSGYSTLSFRVYAPEAQSYIVQINNDTDYPVALEAGWNLVDIPIADLPANDSVAEIRFKNSNEATPSVTLYLDEIGFKN